MATAMESLSLFGTSALSSLVSFAGVSSFASQFHHQSYLLDSLRLLVFGTIIEAGRKLFNWVMERMRFQYSMTVQFTEGDPAYDWIVQYLTQQNVWKQSQEFRVNAKTSKRKWGVKSDEKHEGDVHTEYVPTYQKPQLFRWRRHWLEISRQRKYDPNAYYSSYNQPESLFLTLYSLKMKLLFDFVEEARTKYVADSRPHVTVHLADKPNYGSDFEWNSVKRKIRRPLESIILPDGMMDSLLADAKDFLENEEWYHESGIPHRRGYLLHGPPGTGKSSTIYALAGDLGLEIYSLSLAASFVDDSYLQRAASSLPQNSILLLEDIDCAFPSREIDEFDDEGGQGYPYRERPPRTQVTMSGLLNVLDGVGSDEGRIFFATTNYVDRLDPALIRPGRIDRKISYTLATKPQSIALFLHFYPSSRFPQYNGHDTNTLPEFSDSGSEISDPPSLRLFAERFADGIPQDSFSTAELQGYLLMHRTAPERAAEMVTEWVDQELQERKEKAERAAEKLEKAREARKQMHAETQPQIVVNVPAYPFQPPLGTGEAANASASPGQVGAEGGQSGTTAAAVAATPSVDETTTPIVPGTPADSGGSNEVLETVVTGETAGTQTGLPATSETNSAGPA